MKDQEAYYMKMNPYQGNAPKVLFVCSGGILRSPTCAHVAAAEYGWNTRSAGTYRIAIPQVTKELCIWADKIYTLERDHAYYLSEEFDGEFDDITEVLGIPDNYPYRDPELVRLIKLKLDKLGEIDHEFLFKAKTDG